MDAGADDFITKPFDEDQLAARLRVAERILALHQTLRSANQDLEQRVQERTAELTAANVQLEASREQAEAGSRAKSEFLSRMSHELRTPLNAILGFSQLLKTANLSPKQSDKVEEIISAGYRLLSMVDEMLDLTHSRAKVPATQLIPVDVGALLQETLDETRPLAAYHNVGLESNMSAYGVDSSFIVLANRPRLKQALLHLLSNAIKFNHKHGRVTLHCARIGDRVRIEVHDTGPGISPENINRLFTPFERLDAEERKRDGVGVGLALSKWLVEAMGGQIAVESTVAHGSIFYIEMPVSHE
jgi:signal transduction histidine kinase